MAMDRCKDIYDRIKSGGIQAIQEFIADRAAEELFLDFKRSSNNGDDVRLSDRDRNNLSKAISGFGNSEGGVIVWGIDCSKDVDGADVAKAEVPIVNPERFRSLLEGVVSGCTIPPHSGVENHVIKKDSNTGFVATYIPKSNHAPHQMLPKKQYYIRAGSSFMPTPHDVLAGMFGRRPQPDVFHRFLIGGRKFEGDRLSIDVGVVIQNEGQGIASDIFLSCTFIHTVGSRCKIEFEPKGDNNWCGNIALGRMFHIISRPDYRMPPGAADLPISFKLTFAPPFDSNLEIRGRIGSAESQRYEFILNNDRKIIEDSYHKLTAGIMANSLSEEVTQVLIEDLLGLSKVESEESTV